MNVTYQLPLFADEQVRPKLQGIVEMWPPYHNVVPSAIPAARPGWYRMYDVGLVTTRKSRIPLSRPFAGGGIIGLTAAFSDLPHE